MGRRCARTAWAALLLVACSACSTLPAPAQRLELARSIAAPAQLRLTRLPTTPPMVAAVSSAPVSSDVLTVYIEGDGYAWRTPEWPSTDPTPLDPVALRLAARHGHGAVAWLARPCQYVDAQAMACPTSYWTSQRYGLPSTTLIDQALNDLKTRHGARHLVLVGYSGGGTVAASLASHRPDVIRLVTVAANLDLGQWTAHHGLPALPADQNPALQGGRLREIPQTHFVGARDKVVPPDTVRSYAARIAVPSLVRVVDIPQADHGCCWADLWPTLRTFALPG